MESYHGDIGNFKLACMPSIVKNPTDVVACNGANYWYNRIDHVQSELVTIHEAEFEQTTLFDKMLEEGAVRGKTYPKDVGDPNADFWLRFFIGGLSGVHGVAVADGCNWGKMPALAAEAACVGACEEIGRIFRANGAHARVSDIEKAFSHVVTAAQNAVLPEGYNDSTGTTTLHAGALYMLSSDGGLCYTFVSVGDCKCFLIGKHGNVTDITDGVRENQSNPTDCGGRLGNYDGNGNPDLRNLVIKSVFVRDGDKLLICSDGVHDNFDPEFLGVTIKQALHDARKHLPGAGHGLWKSEYKSWGDLKVAHPEAFADLKNAFRCAFLERMATDRDYAIAPTELLMKIAEHVASTALPSVAWMNENPAIRLPDDYEKYPGKLDHVTAYVLNPYALWVCERQPPIWPKTREYEPRQANEPARAPEITLSQQRAAASSSSQTRELPPIGINLSLLDQEKVGRAQSGPTAAARAAIAVFVLIALVAAAFFF